MKIIKVLIFLILFFKISLVIALEIPVWYWWNNFINNNEENNIYKNIPIWYFWNNFNKQLFYTWTLNQVPVWYFWQYIWQKLVFPKLNKILSDDIDALFWVLNKNTCNTSQKVQNIEITIENNLDLDYLKLSWENIDNSNIKIKRITHPSQEYIINSNINEFHDFDIISWKTYKYFIISYSDCFPWIYSDLTSIKYNKEKQNNWNEFFDIKTYFLLKEMLYIYKVNQKLLEIKKDNISLYFDLKSCFTEWLCVNSEKYSNIKKDIINSINIEKEAINLWINLKDKKTLNYKEFFGIILKVFWKEKYSSLNISEQEYIDNINYLLSNIFNENIIAYDQVSLFSYKRIYFSLIESEDFINKLEEKIR